MLELPESRTISLQAGRTLINKKIIKVVPATSAHKFAFYNGDPAGYVNLLTGRRITSARGHGMFVDICCDEDTWVSVSDGTNMRYYTSSDQQPEKHQLLLVLDDGGCVAFTVAMYGGIWAYQGELDNQYHRGSLNSLSPLNDTFDETFFDNIFRSVTKDISLKALLATEQRIPGLGNGVLQDILFNAGLHPKRKKSTLSDTQKEGLFLSLKKTLKAMTDLSGRDTEKDLFGNSGGYKTLLSKNTVNNPCPGCGGSISKEAYMGGAVYYCANCQRL